MRRAEREDYLIIRSAPLSCLVGLFLLAATMPSTAQPGDPSQTSEAPRLWDIHATQRYQTAGEVGNRQGDLAWRDSAVGVRGGTVVPGLGLLRGGVDYVYTRFSFGSPLRPGAMGFDPFGSVEEIRLSAQVFTPWSETWSSQLIGVVSSAYESGAGPDDAVSGAVVLGMTRRFSDRLSAGFGVLVFHQLTGRGVTFVPLAMVDWQVTERLGLRTGQDVSLTYRLDARRRLSVAAVASFLDRKQFRLAEAGRPAGGAVELGGYEIGCRLIWRPAAGLTLQGTAESVLGQALRVHDRAGRQLVDVKVGNEVRLSVAARYSF